MIPFSLFLLLFQFDMMCSLRDVHVVIYLSDSTCLDLAVVKPSMINKTDWLKHLLKLFGSDMSIRDTISDLPHSHKSIHTLLRTPLFCVTKWYQAVNWQIFPIFERCPEKEKCLKMKKINHPNPLEIIFHDFITDFGKKTSF